jgi:hypothetical protein
MDLKKLYDSLSDAEKIELRGYLNDEYVINNELQVTEWCIRIQPSVRLSNVLRIRF